MFESRNSLPAKLNKFAAYYSTCFSTIVYESIEPFEEYHELFVHPLNQILLQRQK